MSWFQLDAKNIAERVRLAGDARKVPSLRDSLGRGMIGFTLVSIAGFAPWAIFGRWFHRHLGEAGLYAVCALTFIGLSGVVMHKLIIGPGSLPRFYKLFSIAFACYSTAWIVGWMSLGGHTGSLVGLLAGTAVMGWILTAAFGAYKSVGKVIAALFLLNTLGYFVGGWIEVALISMKGLPLSRSSQAVLAMLSWGVSYGIGFGAGLGLAFHLCQARARELIKATD